MKFGRKSIRRGTIRGIGRQKDLEEPLDNTVPDELPAPPALPEEQQDLEEQEEKAERRLSVNLFELLAANQGPVDYNEETTDDFVEDYDFMSFQFDLDSRMAKLMGNLKQTPDALALRKQVAFQFRSMKERMERPPTTRLLDKIAFTLGVGNFGLTFYLLASNVPWVYPWYYVAKAFFLIGARMVIYCSSKQYLFLIDFCYMANAFLVLYICAFFKTPELFLVCFAFANGPLLWAVPTWRNSLVFHSLDKITSVFIHITPPTVTFVLRWVIDPDDKYNIWVVDRDMEWGYLILWLVVVPLAPYLFWQICYALKVYIFDRKKIKKDEEILTSYRVLMSDKKSLIYKLVSIGGGHCSIVIFMVLQFFYTMATMLPVVLYYKFYYAHITVLLIVLIICIWNGAGFYMEVFARPGKYKGWKHYLDKEVEKRMAAASTSDPGRPSDAQSMTSSRMAAKSADTGAPNELQLDEL